MFRYCLGDIPVYRLKYFPKKEISGKLSEYAISWIVSSVERSLAWASRITKVEIISVNVFPVVFFIVVLRC